jgi:acyl dehydratase
VLRRTLLCLLASLALASPAAAGDIGVTLGAKAGTLQVKAPRVELGGTVQVTVTVVDARGSGAGWQLHLGGGGTITRVTTRCAARSTCTLPRGRLTSDGLVAAPHTGMGAIELTITVSGRRGTLGASVR